MATRRRFVFCAWLACAAGLAIGAGAVQAAPLAIHALGAPPPPPAPIVGTGNANGRGSVINTTSRYLTRNGKPWMPLLGEFDYCRYPQKFWNRELLKMRAGGVGIVSTYLYWNVQERVRGKWNWRGRRNLRRFVQLAGRDGLLVWLRLGPWSHGEMRWGGFPDWLENMHIPLRKNAQPYMHFVAALYAQVARQVRGLAWHDGGPLVGVQFDNESGDTAYIAALHRLAVHDGIRVPLNSMTGWPPAAIPTGVMPLFGFYADGFWFRKGLHWAHSQLHGYLFSPPRYTVPRDRPFPWLDTELGGGMAVSYARRPFIAPDDTAAAELVAIGSGLNMPGFYMYHGGRDPIDPHFTFQEKQRCGYNTLPVRNYDFQAPLGEYGQVRPTYNRLRVMAMFQHAFGPALAPMPSYLPHVRPASPADQKTLRWAVRASAGRAFLFLNNYQRRTRLPAHRHVQFSVRLAKSRLLIPAKPITVPSGAYAVWPINMPVGPGMLAYATVQPLTRMTVGRTAWSFYFAWPGMRAELAFKRNGANIGVPPGASHTMVGNLEVIDLPHPGQDCMVTVKGPGGRLARLVVLTRKEALRSYVVPLAKQQRLAIAPPATNLYASQNALQLFSRAPARPVVLRLFPPLPHARLAGASSGPLPAGPVFGACKLAFAPISLAPPTVQQTHAVGPPFRERIGSAGVPGMPDAKTWAASAGRWRVTIPPADLAQSHNVYMHIRYKGDAARLYAADGKLVDDDFWYGRRWTIALNQIAWAVRQGPLTLEILPLSKGAPMYIPRRFLPAFGPRKALAQLVRLSLVPVRHAVLAP